MQLFDLLWLDVFLALQHTLCHSTVGHNIKRQAGFPLHQACVLKARDKKGSERATAREGYRAMGKERAIKK